jgi:rhodanese-related sulfurtransferase
MASLERTPRDALARQQAGAILVDRARCARTRARHGARRARHRARANWKPIPRRVPGPDTELLLICQSGRRSRSRRSAARAGLSQRRLGRRRHAAWAAAGLPMDTPDSTTISANAIRATCACRKSGSRADAPGSGDGARGRRGRLGSPVAYYLAAAGVGTLRIADDDVVDRSNLQRQILHADARIGAPKVESARVDARRARTRARDRSDRGTRDRRRTSNACSRASTSSSTAPTTSPRATCSTMPA